MSLAIHPPFHLSVAIPQPRDHRLAQVARRRRMD